jgi:GT2 family glycosyltransferase
MTVLHILTLNWNGIGIIGDLHKSLKPALDVLKDIQTVWHVRDNGSTDGSLEYINTIKDIPTNILAAGHNRDSFAGGVNSLWCEAKPNDNDYLLLLNNDVVFFDPTSIEKMISLQKATKAGVVGARLLFTGTNKLQHAGVIFSDRYGRMPFHYRPNEPTDAAAEKNRYFQAVTAACCLVKAGAFAKIGGLDEGYRWAFEDIDMCLAIGKDHKIVYCGNTGIFHGESVSLKKNNVNKLFLNPNVKLFREKWTGKYKIDHDAYLRDVNFNVV